MPSWKDGETSSESMLPDLLPMDFAPEQLHDTAFSGIDEEADFVCPVHKKKPRRCVAFEGTNSGRKFYLCSIENQALNCGFLRWIDPEWNDSLQHALSKLWAMYNECHSSKITDRYESSKMLKDLCEEKEKLEKKHACLLEEASRWMDDTERKIQADNFCKINNEGKKEEELQSYITALKHEVEVLKNAKEEMKNVLKSQAEVFKGKQQKWEEERATIKAEKKKYEYPMFDIFKANNANQEKIKRIKAICEEE